MQADIQQLLGGAAGTEGGGREYDASYEFTAPRFYEFGHASPEGQQVDEWFETEETKALHTPEAAQNATKGGNAEKVEERAAQENMPAAAAPAKPVQPAPVPEELQQVRAVLAHIAGNTVRKPVASAKAAAPKQQQAQRPNSLQQAPQQQQQREQPESAPHGRIVPPSQPTRPPTKAAQARPALAQAAPRAEVPPYSKPVTRSISKAPRPQPHTTVPPPRAAPAPPRRAPPRRQAPKLTVPHSPLLRSKHRSEVHQRQMKTSEQLEMEEVEREKKQVAVLRRRNARTMGVALGGAAAMPAPRSRPPKRQATEPQQPQLRTSKRQRQQSTSTTRTTTPVKRGIKRRAPSPRPAQEAARPARRQAPVQRPKLTVPRTPRFATTARARPSRFKPSEMEETERIAAQRKFKPRAVSKSVLEGRPVVTQRHVDAKPPTAPAPFRFATDARAEQRHRPAEHLGPAPFVFNTGGVMTRSRARVTSTAAPRAPLPPPPPAGPSAAAIRLADIDARSSGGSGSGFSFGQRRRTTTGPLLQGGARRVLAAEQPEGGQAAEEQQQQGQEDGMQAVFRGGAPGRTTMHNPLFCA